MTQMTKTDQRPARPQRPHRPQPPQQPQQPQHGGEAGFTLIEMIVALGVMTLVIGGVIALLDLNSRMARAQMNVADMQQSMRVGQTTLARMARMAGRGSLPVFQPNGVANPGKFLPAGVALEVTNNVAADTELGGCACAKVVEGTDILTVRGVFESPIYQLNPAAAGLVLQPNANNPQTGTITVPRITHTGIEQDLTPLQDLIDDPHSEALLLTSPLTEDVYMVVEFTGGNHTADAATLNFSITGGTHAAGYGRLSPADGWPPAMTTLSSVGLLEEYRYYIRELRAIPGDDTSELMPRLSRARVYPGTDAPYRGSDTNLHDDIADNMLDLQVALAVDVDGDRQITEDGTGADEWLFNHSSDDAAATATWNDDARPLFYLRISTLARTDRRDPGYLDPAIDAIEDHVYAEAVTPSDPDEREVRHRRRRLLQTTVDLRNLT